MVGAATPYPRPVTPPAGYPTPAAPSQPPYTPTPSAPYMAPRSGGSKKLVIALVALGLVGAGIGAVLALGSSTNEPTQVANEAPGKVELAATPTDQTRGSAVSPADPVHHAVTPPADPDTTKPADPTKPAVVGRRSARATTSAQRASPVAKTASLDAWW